MMRTTAAAHQLEPRVPAPVAAVRDLRHEIKRERRMQLELLEAASRLSQEEEEEEEKEGRRETHASLLFSCAGRLSSLDSIITSLRHLSHPASDLPEVSTAVLKRWPLLS